MGRPHGLFFYTDDGGHDDFFDLRLSNRKLRLRFKRPKPGRPINEGTIKANKDLAQSEDSAE